MRTFDHRIAFVIGCTTALGAFAVAVAACSDDDKPPAGDLSSGSTPGPSPTAAPTSTIPKSDAATSSSGGDAAAGDSGSDAGSVCGATINQQGLEVEEWAQPQDVPTTFYGGKIVNGTYTLVELNTYVGPQPPPPGGEGAPATKTGKAKRATLVVTAAGFTFLEAAGQKGALPAATQRGVTYTIKDTKTLSTQAVCPAGAPGNMVFNAGPRVIELLVDATHSERYDLTN